MSKHTPTSWIPEPWGIEYTESNLWIGPLRTDGSGKCDIVVFSTPIGGLRNDVVELCRHTAARIVACVNALAGIPDPAAFVARAKRIEEAARNFYIMDANKKLNELEMRRFNELGAALEGK